LPLWRNCRINDALESTPEAVNADPYGAGWMIKLKFQMLRIMILCFHEAYKELIGA
jgi:glycine cleavage system H protein